MPRLTTIQRAPENDGQMRMDRDPKVLGLQKKVLAAIAECGAAMQDQFLALVAGDTDLARFDRQIAAAQEKRQRAMDALLNHIRMHGWR
jgi:hypothetical protein